MQNTIYLSGENRKPTRRVDSQSTACCRLNPLEKAGLATAECRNGSTRLKAKLKPGLLCCARSSKEWSFLMRCIISPFAVAWLVDWWILRCHLSWSSAVAQRILLWLIFVCTNFGNRFFLREYGNTATKSRGWSNGQAESTRSAPV